MSAKTSQAIGTLFYRDGDGFDVSLPVFWWPMGCYNSWKLCIRGVILSTQVADNFHEIQRVPRFNNLTSHKLFWASANFLPYICLLCNAFSVFAQTTDDPFITFRYAANLLSGYGPVFNIGEHVEGFSSPLHLILSALLILIFPSIAILFKAKLASLLFAALSLRQLRIFAKEAGLNDKSVLIALLLLSMNINFAIAAVNGLETTLYVFLLLLFVQKFYTECRLGNGLTSAIFAFLLLLTRPDSLVIISAFSLFRCLWSIRKNLSAQFYLGWFLLFLIPASFFILARIWYYHLPLPNTFYAKHSNLGSSLHYGLGYLRQPLSPEVHTLNSQSKGFLNINSLVFAPVFYGLALLGLYHIYRKLIGLISVTVVACIIIFVLVSGGDWMPGWRFMVPSLPYFAIMQATGIIAIDNYSCRRIQMISRCHILTYFSLLFWLFPCLISTHYSWASIRYSTEDRLLTTGDRVSPWVVTANYIKKSFPIGSYIAYSEMGYAGYINMDKKFLDTRGLTNHQIADFPVRYKSRIGVEDDNWMKPNSPLYHVLEMRRPNVIISFDGNRSDLARSNLENYRKLELKKTSQCLTADIFVWTLNNQKSLKL